MPFVLICAALALGASAQSSENTGIILITVKSADGAAPLSNARVFLLGPSVASALTNKQRHRQVHRRRDRHVSRARQQTRLPQQHLGRVRAARQQGSRRRRRRWAPRMHGRARRPRRAPTTAGRRSSARSSARVTVSTHDVDEDSAVRRISDSLIDALNTRGRRRRDAVLERSRLAANDLAARARRIADGRDARRDPALGAGHRGELARHQHRSVHRRQRQLRRARRSARRRRQLHDACSRPRPGSTRGSTPPTDRSTSTTGRSARPARSVTSASRSSTTKRGGNNPLDLPRLSRPERARVPARRREHERRRVAEAALRADRQHDPAVHRAREQSGDRVAVHAGHRIRCRAGSVPNNTATSKFQFVYGTVQSLVGQVALQATGYISSHEQLISNEINRFIDECVGARGAVSGRRTVRDRHRLAHARHRIAKPRSAKTTTRSPSTRTTFAPRRTSRRCRLGLAAIAGHDPLGQRRLGDRPTRCKTRSRSTIASRSDRCSRWLRRPAPVPRSWPASAATGARTTTTTLRSQRVSSAARSRRRQVVRSFSDPQSARVNCAGGRRRSAVRAIKRPRSPRSTTS